MTGLDSGYLLTYAIFQVGQKGHQEATEDRREEEGEGDRPGRNKPSSISKEYYTVVAKDRATSTYFQGQIYKDSTLF